MKKSVKVCLAMGITLSVLGVGITTAAAAMGGTMVFDGQYDLWSYAVGSRDSISPDLTDGKTYTFTDVKKLDLEVDEGFIEFLEAEDGTQGDTITVYTDAPYAKTSVEQSGSTLDIRLDRIRRRGIFSAGNNASNVKIVIPKGYRFEEVNLELGASECSADALLADELELDAGVGAVDIRYGEVGTLNAQCGVGEIQYRGSVSGDVKLDTGVGDIDLNLIGQEGDYNYRISCGIGSISVGSTNYSGFSGDKRIDNGSFKDMELECGVGSILVTFEQQQ